MATFLELVNDVERESGTVSQSQRLTTVANPRGRQEKIVAWTRQAWQMIQRERQDWTFRRAAFAGNLTIGQTHYTPAGLGITDFAGWEKATPDFQPFSIFDPAIGRGDENQLRLMPFRMWLDAYDRGVQDQQRPNVASYSWNRELVLGPPADKAYTVRGWYKREIQALTLDADTPYIDEEFHQAIVWRALMLLGEDDEAAFEVASSGRQYAAMHSAMLAAYLEPIEFA